MKKGKLLFLISIILFILAFILLIVSMIFHAVQGNESVLSTVLAVFSALFAFIGLALALISGKFKEKEVKYEKSE